MTSTQPDMFGGREMLGMNQRTLGMNQRTPCTVKRGGGNIILFWGGGVLLRVKELQYIEGPVDVAMYH